MAKRTKQVSVKLTPEEKGLFKKASEKQGFKGIADFLRVTVLKAIHKA